MIWNDSYILSDYSSVQYNVRRDELASFPSNSLSKARAVFKKMLTVRAKLKKNRTLTTVSTFLLQLGLQIILKSSRAYSEPFRCWLEMPSDSLAQY